MSGGAVRKPGTDLETLGCSWMAVGSLHARLQGLHGGGAGPVLCAVDGWDGGSGGALASFGRLRPRSPVLARA